MYKVFTCTFERVCTISLMQKASKAAWIRREFGAVDFKDQRLKERAQVIAQDMSDHPEASIARASGTWARTKGAYRFFDNEAVTGEEILASHRAATFDRMAEEKLILMVQDTTGLNFACQKEDSGLGSLGNRGDAALGMWLHTTLCMQGEGMVFGIAQAQMWVRRPGRMGIAARRKERPMEDKESYRWLKSFNQSVEVARRLPQTRVVNIADREGDIYELFVHAAKNPVAGVLVRSRHDRRVEKEQQRLWDLVAHQPVAGEIEITVPRQPGVPSYRARLEVRFRAAQLAAPKGQPGGIKIWVIEARQTGVNAAKALCWRLVTNLPVTDLNTAVEKVQWYRLRWRIEEYHRVLKNGCKTERRQLEQLRRLQNVLAIDMVIAWRVMELTQLSRQTPNAPATEMLAEDEVHVICAMTKKFAQRQTLTLNEAVRAVAQWGGFLARKSDGEPGPMAIWSGLRCLNNYLSAFNTMKLMGNA
jgi:hypothetical protein